MTDTDAHNHALAESAATATDMNLAGMLTDYELLVKLQEIAGNAVKPAAGLLDITTGLRY